MKHYTFKLTVIAGCDEYWEELLDDDKSGCDQLRNDIMESLGDWTENASFKLKEFYNSRGEQRYIFEFKLCEDDSEVWKILGEEFKDEKTACDVLHTLLIDSLDTWMHFAQLVLTEYKDD